MKQRAFFIGFSLALAFPAICPGQSTSPESNWPHWRGPNFTGTSETASPPVEWSEDENLRWKTPLPGLGHSSPVVFGDHVFVTTSIPIGENFPPKPDLATGAHDNLLVSSKWQFAVLAFHRKTGEILWQTAVHEAVPKEGGHNTGTLASASPTTDGIHVYAFFGSHGLYCLDVKTGKVRWSEDFGDMQTKHGHGEGCSPVLHGDRIFVNWDHEGLSFIGALDKTTGKKIWRKPRNERTTWTSPIVIEHEGKPQLIAAGTERIRAYDPGDGELIWECGGLSDNVVATPVYESGRLLATSSYDFQSMLAIDLVGASGDLTDSDHIKWTRRKRTPYIPSPLLVNGHVFYLAHYQGVLSRVNLKTGDELTGPFRLGNLRDIYASPVAAKGRIYVVDRSGITLVLSDDPEPQPLAQNQLNDRFSATPALVGRALFLRGESFLYCLSNLEK